jgi:hypothetical protein
MLIKLSSFCIKLKFQMSLIIVNKSSKLQPSSKLIFSYINIRDHEPWSPYLNILPTRGLSLEQLKKSEGLSLVSNLKKRTGQKLQAI